MSTINTGHGYVFINTDGQFLTVSQTQTHTGNHTRVAFTSDLNKASVLPRLDAKILREHPHIAEELTQLPAMYEIVRNVKITKE